PEELNRLAVNGIVDRYCPEERLALLLAPCPQLRHTILKLLALVCKVHVEVHVARILRATVNGQTRFEALRVEEGIGGLGLPERRQHLAMNAVLVPRLRVDAVAKPLPVV